ncbi:IclR family transcriptional regulator [Burkholderia multivorans]|uniref:helix-turn-helix domain-containing protein n=1 Tax=Burkholderia multivorans TaxID=87883 RepID=UPI000755CE82|nr:helix-turn-helix domain-containing protein [Burkholderia multivorans]KVQ75365.1 IclR family transcriptional regulator [Burkholderia multivorans]
MTLPGNDEGIARYRVPALARGLAIVEAVAAAHGGASGAALAARLGAPRNSVARLLKTLVRHGLLVVDAYGRYRPGPASARIAAAYLGAQAPVVQAQPVLDALCARSGLAAQLLGRDGAEAVVLAQAVPAGAACVVTRVGARFAGLAAQPDETGKEGDRRDAAERGAPPVWRLGLQGETRRAPGLVAMPVDARGALAIGVALDAPDDARWQQVPALIADAARHLSRTLAAAADC